MLRSPYDGLGEAESARTATVSDPDEIPVVRPEFAAECDLNTILSRAMPFEARRPTTDYVDYRDTLQDALEAVAMSRDAWQKLPRDVTQRYRNWLEFAQAVEFGQYQPPTPPAEVSSAGGAGAPSAGPTA
ncbi:MAG: internal scaffolding protein [Microviridae sp.]|nr:MAG: internal scaffolding protein [Microviridae sp.]